MKIGVVSDSHGHAKRLSAALDILNAGGAEAIVHCGDIGSVECLELLGRTDVETYAVAGNMDRHVDRLEAVADKLCVHFSAEVVEAAIGDNKRLAVVHGHDKDILAELVAGGQFPYICRGHSHRTADEKTGEVRIVNPGALRHCKSPRHPSAALIDTESDSVEFVRIPR